MLKTINWERLLEKVKYLRGEYVLADTEDNTYSERGEFEVIPNTSIQAKRFKTFTEVVQVARAEKLDYYFTVYEVLKGYKYRVK